MPLSKDRQTREHESYALRDDMKTAQKTIDKDLAGVISANINLNYLLSTGADLSGIITNDNGELLFNSTGSFLTE